MLKSIIEEEKVTQFGLLLLQARKIVIVAHVSPDGDAIGSSLGFAHFLRSLGKQVTIIVPNPFPAFLKWMPGSKDIMIYERLKPYADKYIHDAQLICCLDFNCLRRIEEVSNSVKESKAKKVMIDHHPNPEEFCNITISIPGASSTSEIIFHLIYAMHRYRNITLEAAQCIYAGMMTDTGGFTYNSTRPDIYMVISMLLSKGIDKDDIYNKVYHTYSESRLRLMGYVLENMKVYPDCHASLITLSKEEQSRYEYAKGDSEGFVNLPLQIKDSILSCFLREDTERAIIKVSLRSVGDFSCTEIAEKYFNGGGHLNASGGEIQGTMEQAIARWEEVLDIIRPTLQKDEKKENNNKLNTKSV
jgi:phosphoesterase RecJ-like protein